MAVPRLGELKRLPLAEASDGSSTDPAGELAADRSGAGGAVFLAAATLAAICLLTATFCLIRYLTLDVPMTTEGHIADIEQTYLQASPAQLVLEYESVNRFGVDLPQPYAYYDQEVRSNQWRLWTTLFAVAGLVSLITAIVAGRGGPRHRDSPGHRIDH